MFERDYIDVENFVSEYDDMTFDPDEENLFHISEEGEWVSDSGDCDDFYDDDDDEREDYEASDW